MQSLPEISFATFAGMREDAARTLVLTVNNRHARRLLADLSTHAVLRAVRQVPRILPLSAWMRQMADALSFTQPVSAQVLSAFGAQQLWAQVIAQEESARPLLDVQQAARLAMQADHLMVDWQLHVPEHTRTFEAARFAQWRRAYLTQLKHLDAQDDVRLMESVLHAAARGVLPMSFDRIVLAGFTECSPAVQILLTHWQAQGLNVARLDTTTAQTVLAVRTTAQTHEAQWRAAAAWAAQQLQQYPNGRFAIVAAQLETDMPFAQRVLRAALGEASYNMTVARPLAQWPLVRAALAWLRVLARMQMPNQDHACDVAHVGQALLAGGCIGHAQQASGCAMLDARWRHQGITRITNKMFVKHLLENAPDLARAWQNAWCVALREMPATLDIWMARFRDALRCLRFPGDAMQDSVAHQTLQALTIALDHAATQAFAFGTLQRHQALHLLEGVLQQTYFQPMRAATARLDVLGMLEADGGRWDAIWVLGLHDAILPAVPCPNPLLPLSVLRQAGTPRATLTRELQWAQSMRDILLRCAPHVLFSHAQEHNAQPLRVSSLLADLPQLALTSAIHDIWHVVMQTAHDLPDADAQTQTDALRATPVRAICLETMLDTQAPPLTGQILRGGVGVIDTQARHPLWAFVKYRLGASQMPDYASIAASNTRGNFLHYCMELIWRILPDQAALQQSWAQDRLSALVTQAITQAAGKHLQDYSPTLKRLEMQRAETVIHDWLSLERERTPFRIQGVEQTVHWCEGPLALRVRLDRLDVLDDGGLAIMDYKTGSSSIAVRNDWMRDRPVNLQLPFYAAMLPHAPHQVVALLLVNLHARRVVLRGLARNPDMKGVDAPDKWPMFEQMTWDEIMQHWRTAICAIARELIDGSAPNVVRRMSDLQYCDVLPFLRLNEVIAPGQSHAASAK